MWSKLHKPKHIISVVECVTDSEMKIIEKELTLEYML